MFPTGISQFRLIIPTRPHYLYIKLRLSFAKNSVNPFYPQHHNYHFLANAPISCYNWNMNLTSPAIIKELLAKHGARPSKRMGQNFLIDASVLTKIIDAAKLTKEDIVLEVGPGLGTLTQELAKKVKKVIAIEKDPVVLNILKETTGSYKNIEIIQDDILKLSIANFQLSNYKLIANIPYYITSPIIRKFLEEENKPGVIILMVQKEVAQRICAAPPDMSILAASVQFYAKPRIISYVSKGCFWPPPNVDSAIIEIIPLKEKRDVPDEDFFKILKAGFCAPRKQLANNLSTALKRDKKEVSGWLLQNGIAPTRRAETLSIEEWKRLATQK